MTRHSNPPPTLRFTLAIPALAVALPAVLLALSQISAVRSETLLRSTTAWNGAPYAAYPVGAPELTVLRITIPAHGELSWHKHPMPNAAYLLSGEITVEDQAGHKRHFAAGQAIPETVNTLHRGTVGDQPAVFIVFYAGVKDMPLSQKPE